MRRVVLLFFFIFSISIFALDTKLSLEVSGETNTWDVGEIKDFKIILHPISEVNDVDLKESLLSRDLADLIKILKIDEQRPLKENPQYYIVNARGLLLKEPKPNFPIIWDYRGMAVAVDYSKIQFSNNPVNGKELFIFDKSIAVGFNKFLVFGIIIFVTGVLICFLYFLKKMKLRQNQIRDQKNKIEKFKLINNREGHEYIFKNKDEFVSIFSNSQYYNEYLKEINSIQYKKNWNDRDLEAIESAHTKAKESIVVR